MSLELGGINNISAPDIIKEGEVSRQTFGMRKVYCPRCGKRSIIELSCQIINNDCSCGMNTPYKHMTHGERRIKERRMTVTDYDHMLKIDKRIKDRRVTAVVCI